MPASADARPPTESIGLAIEPEGSIDVAGGRCLGSTRCHRSRLSE
jgi:hypothetical protein